MVEGRGSAVVTLGLLMVLLQCEVATSDLVGDGYEIIRWAMNMTRWDKDKKFAVGENLVFLYLKSSHNVTVVNKAGYDACKAAPSDKVYTSGHDRIPLKKGDNYFICTASGHCPPMKIKVTAI